jgi:hypothetical protein
MSNQLKTRPGITNNECFTPKWIFDTLQIEFDLDVCAPDQPTHVPAKNKYTIENDGLKCQWFGNVWMNPPFSKPLPWVQRFIQHSNGIALLPTSTGKWQLQIWNDPTNKWVMLEPMKFDGYKQVLPTRCYLVAYGQHNIELLDRFGVVR